MKKYNTRYHLNNNTYLQASNKSKAAGANL